MRGSDTSERASTTFCWLPPESWPTGLSASGVAIAERLDHLLARASPARRRDRRRSQPRLVCSARTMFSRTLSSATMPSALRSSGQNAIPCRSDCRGDCAVIGSPADLERPGIRPDRAEDRAWRPRCAPSRAGRRARRPRRRAAERSNGAMVRRRPTPSATRIGSPFAARRVATSALLGLLEFAPEHHRDQFERRQFGRRRRRRPAGRCAGPRCGRRSR